MIVLGQHPDDKGTQLERLTQSLLEKKGYRNVSRSWIGSGGDEIDVQGEFPTPMLKGAKTVRLICECKAYKDTVNLPEWLKFCGKLFVAKQTLSAEHLGCFVALSGVNGNVRGSYDALKESNASIELVTGDDLNDLVQQVLPHEDRKQALERVARATDRIVTRSELMYYDNRVYWLVLFEKEAYTVLRGDGNSLSDEEATLLNPMIAASQPLTTYVDLQAEARAQAIARTAETTVIGRLMTAGGVERRDLVSVGSDGLSEADLAGAGDRLLASGVLIATDAESWGLPDTEYDKVATVFRTLFAWACPISPLGCDWYDNHINGSLLDEIRRIQGGLMLDEAATKTAIQALQMSPTALRIALNPIPVITNGLEQLGVVVPEVVRKGHQDYFLNHLFAALEADFNQPALSNFFYVRREIRELEVRRSYFLKNATGICLQHETRKRRLHGFFAGGGEQAVLMLALDSQPEPWASTETVTPVGDQPPPESESPSSQVTGVGPTTAAVPPDKT